MDCGSLDRIIATPSTGDGSRREALRQLIYNGCLASLYTHAYTSSRMDWIRNFALLALTKFATLNTEAVEVAITLQDEEIILSNDLDKLELKNKAARLLFMFTSTPKKPRTFKKISLMGLIAGEHWDYCDEIENDPNTESWISSTITAAKKTKK
ncbi:MAG: hypothetical protein GOP50_01210 [Candidatus Heimdallarchaeota archaeon]|nr:hypothetical protein [Candidatus Heimdallarchaeota archaeon]